MMNGLTNLLYAWKQVKEPACRSYVRLSCRRMCFAVVNLLELHGAQESSDQIPERSVVYWTSLISMQTKRGFNDHALMHFLEMRRVGIQPNEVTFSVAVGACNVSDRTDLGKTMHCLILKKGFARQMFIACGLIQMYSKWGHIEEAREVFNEMPERDPISWNSIISGYSQNGLSREAIDLFSWFIANDNDWKSLLNYFTMASVLKACTSWGCLKIGKSIHGYAIKFDIYSDVFVAASLIDMYSKCSGLDGAFHVFDRMGKQDLIVWNAMIGGYAQNSCSKEATYLFRHLQHAGFLPNQTTFASMLKCLAETGDTAEGQSFHAKIIRCGCLEDIFVGTALVDMYSKCLEMEDAERAFNEMKIKNVVSFNTLITGYGLVARYDAAVVSYLKMRKENMEPDEFTLSNLLSSCALLVAVSEGIQIHCHAIKFGLESNVSVANSLVGLYASYGCMDSALKAFNSVRVHNNISWAGIISAFAKNDEGENALKYFCKMQILFGKPDEFSCTSVLKVVASWASLEHGNQIHAYSTKMGFESTVFVGSALVDMYSKCGKVEDSFKVFIDMPEKNIVAWNSIIIGNAQNGRSEKSLCLFSEMKEFGLNPTCVTFIAILFACSHAGLAHEGKCFYDMMINEYGIPPSIEHIACMVDLLGRGGYLDEALTFLTNSQFSSEPTIWQSILAACRVHKNMEIGIEVTKHILNLQPLDSAMYVLLSDIFALKSSWSEVGQIRDLMRCAGIKKDPGCSWISTRNILHAFVAEDTRQFQKEVVAILESLIVHSKEHGSCSSH